MQKNKVLFFSGNECFIFLPYFKYFNVFFKVSRKQKIKLKNRNRNGELEIRKPM